MILIFQWLLFFVVLSGALRNCTESFFFCSAISPIALFAYSNIFFRSAGVKLIYSGCLSFGKLHGASGDKAIAQNNNNYLFDGPLPLLFIVITNTHFGIVK